MSLVIIFVCKWQWNLLQPYSFVIFLWNGNVLNCPWRWRVPCQWHVWINTRVNRNRIHQGPSSNCNHRLVYLRQWHIQMEIDITPYLFLTISMQLGVKILFWHYLSDLLDRVCQLSLSSVGSSLSTPLLILYRMILFSAVECFWIQINHWTAK